jgi:hypothetical protein
MFLQVAVSIRLQRGARMTSRLTADNGLAAVVPYATDLNPHRNGLRSESPVKPILRGSTAWRLASRSRAERRLARVARVGWEGIRRRPPCRCLQVPAAPQGRRIKRDAPTLVT